MDFIHKFIPAGGLESNKADKPKGAAGANSGKLQEGSPTNQTTLVLLHGTGGDEEDLLELGRFLAPDAALLGVRGKVMEGAAQRFFRRLAEGVFDEEDLKFRTHELARFLEQAVDAYGLDGKRLVAVGYSNGANIAASMLLLEPGILTGAVLLRAMLPLLPPALPDIKGKPILLEAGRQDPIVPAPNTEQLAQLLKQAGADVTLEWENAGHGLTNSELESASRWMNRYFG